VETKKLVEVYKTQAQILYSPKPIQVSKIHLIRANDLLPEFLEGIPDSIVDDPFWGWQSFSRTTVSIDFVSGNHHTMLMQPNVQELSKKIELGLKKDESHNLADMKIR
jgi:thioesterase domain-containing protein